SCQPSMPRLIARPGCAPSTRIPAIRVARCTPRNRKVDETILGERDAGPVGVDPAVAGPDDGRTFSLGISQPERAARTGMRPACAELIHRGAADHSSKFTDVRELAWGSAPP